MKYIKSDDFIKLIGFNYKDSETLSFDKLLKYGNIENHLSYVHHGFEHKINIKKSLKHVKENLNWNVYCAITSPLVNGMTSLAPYVVYKPRSVGATTMANISYIKVFSFIKDKTPDELIDICKKIVKLKAFV